MNATLDRIFALSPDIRYVALLHRGRLTSAARAGLSNASASESDKYEELLVNPTLLTLATRRGEIDCGGLDYMVLRYGSFFELVYPIADGHLSIGIEPHADPLALVPGVRAVAESLGA